MLKFSKNEQQYLLRRVPCFQENLRSLAKLETKPTAEQRQLKTLTIEKIAKAFRVHKLHANQEKPVG